MTLNSKTKLILWLLIATFSLQAQISDTTKQQKASAITLAPHLTELVFSAGGGDLLVGISAYSDFPQAALDKQVIGDAFHLNLELIKQINPTVIFYWQNGTPQQTINKLREMEFNLVAIKTDQLADIPKAIKQIATILNTQAVEQTNNFNPSLEKLKSTTTTTKTALIQISDQPIYTVDSSHWMSEAAAVCGLENIFKELPTPSAAVNLESIVLNKPEVLIRIAPFTKDKQLAQWESIPAVKNQHIAVLEADHFTRPTLRILKAIQSLCKQANDFGND